MNNQRLLASLILILITWTTGYAGSWVEGTAKSSAGSISYKLWVPGAGGQEKRAPLMLMLHGCMQGPDDLAALSQMNELADKEKFFAVYPQQTAAANPLRCWNWFVPRNQERDAGEPSLIAAVVQQVRASQQIDDRRIYVVGISAGGAMAVLMATAYPEIFSAVGVIASPEYKAATSVESGLAVMKNGGPDPIQQGVAAFQAMQKIAGHGKKRIPLINFQGSKDPYVNPVNADQLIAQWAQTNDLLDDGTDNDSVSTKFTAAADGMVTNGYQYTKYSYRDAKGGLLLEKWIVNGLGHAWSGSSFANQFADPKGPNATIEIWRFFRETAGLN